MADVEVIQVIKTRLTVLGKGSMESPIRRLDQYWDMQGNLLWQYDPSPDEEHIEIMEDGTARPIPR